MTYAVSLIVLSVNCRLLLIVAMLTEVVSMAFSFEISNVISIREEYLQTDHGILNINHILTT